MAFGFPDTDALSDSLRGLPGLSGLTKGILRLREYIPIFSLIYAILSVGSFCMQFARWSIRVRSGRGHSNRRPRLPLPEQLVLKAAGPIFTALLCKGRRLYLGISARGMQSLRCRHQNLRIL